MPTGPVPRAVALLYILPYSALAAGLLLVGFAVDRTPLLPGALSGAYQRWLFTLLAAFARPADGLAARPPDPGTPGATHESSP